MTNGHRVSARTTWSRASHAARVGLLLAMMTACIDPPTAPTAMRLTAEPQVAEGTMSSAPADTLIRRARWDGLAGHDADGTVTVEYRPGNIAIVTLGADFRASRVPDPQLYLNTSGNPNRGTPLRFARLDAFTGAQRYIVQLPAGYPAYTHVLLWCDRYNQGVGAATLTPKPGGS